MRIAVYNLHLKVLGGGERKTLVLAEHLSRSNEVSLYCLEPADRKILKRAFGVDLTNVEIIPLAGRDHFEVITDSGPDLFINNCHSSRLPSPAPLGIFMCMFPDQEPIDLTSYQVIAANSVFTARWTAKWWGRRAEVVHPPCESMGPPAAKEKMILNVARFFADDEYSHCKRQDVLLDGFLALSDLHAGGWELHLVGNIGQRPEDEVFVQQLQEKARGAAVHFHFGLGLEQLRDLYRRAPIYWHATGFGSDAERSPHRQEHFGMSVVEAMSAGAVPLAVNAGGPRETIDQGYSGFLWDYPGDLVANTRALVANDALREAISNRAVVASQKFTTDRFLARMDTLVNRLAREREVSLCGF